MPAYNPLEAKNCINSTHPEVLKFSNENKAIQKGLQIEQRYFWFRYYPLKLYKRYYFTLHRFFLHKHLQDITKLLKIKHLLQGDINCWHKTILYAIVKVSRIVQF